MELRSSFRSREATPRSFSKDDAVKEERTVGRVAHDNRFYLFLRTETYELLCEFDVSSLSKICQLPCNMSVGPLDFVGSFCNFPQNYRSVERITEFAETRAKNVGVKFGDQN